MPSYYIWIIFVNQCGNFTPKQYGDSTPNHMATIHHFEVIYTNETRANSMLMKLFNGDAQNGKRNRNIGDKSVMIYSRNILLNNI
jgi:hypothetical protein